MDSLVTSIRGVASIEQVTLLVTVVIGAVCALMLLIPLLINAHDAIEFVLSLPIP